MKKKLKGNLILLLTAIIWGSGFVCQSMGMDSIGPNTFIGIRTLFGALVLLPVICFREYGNKSGVKKEYGKRNLILGGIACGVLLCAASTVQTLGLKYTTSGKSGFITAMYIVIVPFLGIFMKKKVGILTYIGAIIALLGLYMLSFAKNGFNVNLGDALTLVCAFLFSFHILVVDYMSDKADGVKLSCVQFFVCGLLNLVIMFLFEKPEFDTILYCWKPILYSGVLSCGVGYTLQIVGQKYTDPTPAAIIMSLESVFAAIFGALILKEYMGVTEILGCVIMFAAIIIVQLPEDFLKNISSQILKKFKKF